MSVKTLSDVNKSRIKPQNKKKNAKKSKSKKQVRRGNKY
jgi:hypothetical protein